MTRREEDGIAADSELYEGLLESTGDEDVKGPVRRTSSVAGGIANDAQAFEGILSESTDTARTLDSNWIYELDGRVFGPLKPTELLELLYSGEITGDTLLAPEETGELQPLNRFGVFRVHLPKAKQQQEARREAQRREKAEAKARLTRRIGFILSAAGVLGVLSAGVAYWIRAERRETAAREKAIKEAKLKQELDSLLASVTIQPPLLPLVDEEEAETAPQADPSLPSDRKSSKRSSGHSRRRARGVARMTGAAELTNQEVMSGVARAFGGFKRCIVAQIQRDPDSVPSELVLIFSIGNDGVPKDFSLKDRRLRTAPISACMAKQLAQVTWRAFKGEVRNVEYPITISR
ncbi:MAG: hypothetical protein IPK13_25895 [Deltaproteobacteria bacterium]|nr:hypothetical protein [Deltaproteobacteria bacterium]